MKQDQATILIVEDDPLERSGYVEMLALLGERVLTASSLVEAIRLVAANDVALLLLGANLPGKDGVEFADLVRGHRCADGFSILFVTGEAETGPPPDSYTGAADGYLCGAVDTITAPVVPALLRAKVRVFADLRRKTRQLERLNSELDRRVEERTKELRQSEQEFRTRADLLELASEAIIVRRLEDGALQFWNAGAENLYGWDRAEVLGQDIHQLLRTEFPISRQATENELIKMGSWHGDLVQQSRSGREIVVACRKTLNREGTAVLEVGRDITMQLRAEEALRESEKLAAMGRMAGTIAHEINNPLAAITNIFYLLQHHASLDEEAHRYADAAERELERVAHITRQTLTFYREAKQPAPVRVQELLDDVVELQKPAFQAHRIVVRKNYLDTRNITGFPVELRQVFLNLIANAIQAMPEGGTLRLHVRESTDWRTGQRGPAVSVVDTGTGIRREDAKRLFEPFFSTKNAKGTGLGLWISKGILQKYGGHISYRTHRVEGKPFTCFRVFIPIAGTQWIKDDPPQAEAKTA